MGVQQEAQDSPTQQPGGAIPTELSFRALTTARSVLEQPRDAATPEDLPRVPRHFIAGLLVSIIL